MFIEDEIFINQYGQELKSESELLTYFESFDDQRKELFLTDLLFLILQSKATLDDVDLAIKSSKLKPTLTPCVMLKKGVSQSNMTRLITLKGKERVQSIILLINLFKVSYKRRFESEKGDPNKWWYWDLSSKENLNKIRKQII